MSCTCKNRQKEEPQFNCPCDNFEHPLPLNIGAGLSGLPRQIAGFPEFRRAMLFALRQKEPLDSWRARKSDDLGVMLLEMWAYVCDVLSFYDKVIADEAYVRTARLRPSLRRLTALLGYLPRPAVAATVKLAALADGRLPVTLPAGTAFRSSSPPQVFELDADTAIDPLTSRWNILAPHPGVILSDNPSFLLIQAQANIEEDSLLLLIDKDNPGQTQALRVEKAGLIQGKDGRRYTKVEFTEQTHLAAGTPLNRLRLMMPAQSATLWTLSTAISGKSISLDGVYKEFTADDYVLIRKQKGEAYWCQVKEMKDEQKIIETDGFKSARIATKLTLDIDNAANSNRKVTTSYLDDEDRAIMRIHYGMIPAGTVVDEAKQTLSHSDPLEFEGRIEAPVNGQSPDRFFLTDKNFRGLNIEGSVDFVKGALRPGPNQDWDPELTLPVEVMGNVITASRGEAVRNEILGSGNANIPNQAFKLKKKPLTYLFAPTASNDQGIASTLRVYVNGIKWKEVSSFYGKTPEDEVYLIRQNDDGDSLATFGDGTRGRRLPTGANNVVAYYRYGAGQASPPAGSINQIETPVPGLSSIRNPIPAAGGADAEGPEQLRTHAPKSALILGRAVSMVDMEAVALAVPGVRSVQAEWRWHGSRQQAGVQIWYIGEDNIKDQVTKRLHDVTYLTTPITVEQAQVVAAELSLDIEIDPRYIEKNVLAEVRTTLTNAETGLLAPENVGIGKPMFRSRIFEAVLSVEGTVAVRGIFWNGASFTNFGKTPGAGRYFDFERGSLQLKQPD